MNEINSVIFREYAGKLVADLRYGQYTKCECFIKDVRGEREVKLYLISSYDKYEDGYHVVAIHDNGKVLASISFDGNCCYPSQYANSFAGERTFNGIKSLFDFNKLKDNRYYFVKG